MAAAGAKPAAGAALPDAVRAYRRTPVFTEASVPAGLLKEHSTKAGVWGVITVLSGRLEYAVPSNHETVILDPDRSAVIAPTVPHRVTPLGAVSFYVEFWR